MLLFTSEPVKKALTLTHFIDFITEIAPLYDEEIPLSLIARFPWDDIQKILHEFIIIGLNNLTDSDSQPPNPPLPQFIKGVYFCLAEDAYHFSIHGSLYYNENDWAAGTDYDYKESTELFTQLSRELVSLKLDSEITQDLLYMFAVFTLLKTLKTIDNIPDIANAAMALGYCDGDILILGHFIEQQFSEHLEIIEDGQYDNSSTQPVQVHKPVAPRGDLWSYMKSNCMVFINDHGLTERFYEFGETEAKRISDEFKSQLILNQCPLCNAIKKTARARLCLKCGEFTPPRVNTQ